MNVMQKNSPFQSPAFYDIDKYKICLKFMMWEHLTQRHLKQVITRLRCTSFVSGLHFVLFKRCSRGITQSERERKLEGKQSVEIKLNNKKYFVTLTSPSSKQWL